MRKRRKVLVILGLIALAAVCFVTLRPRDEPKYQGRYLSDWMEIYVSNYQHESSPGRVEAERAVQHIGTKALHYFLNWIRHEQSAWERTVLGKLPNALKSNRMVNDWLDGSARRRANHGLMGMYILGTNGVAVIPELAVMLQDRTATERQIRAIYALAYVGEPAIPVMRIALADTNQMGRAIIVWALGEMAANGHTNTCLPILLESLSDQQAAVRSEATKALQRIVPEAFTNAPAN